MSISSALFKACKIEKIMFSNKIWLNSIRINIITNKKTQRVFSNKIWKVKRQNLITNKKT